MGKTKSLLKVAAINAAGLGVALLAGEIVLRITKPEAVEARLAMNNQIQKGIDQVQTLFDKEKFHFATNSTGQQLHSEYQHDVQHDQHGWRNPCFDNKNPASAIIIGDSYTYGIGVGDNDLLQCQIKALDPKSNIYAMGVPGAAISQYIRIVKTQSELIKSLSPNKSVINLALCMGNDYEDLVAYGAYRNDTKMTIDEVMPQFKTNRLNGWLGSINTALMQQPWIANSRLVTSIKMSLMQSMRTKDHGNFYSNYGGQTFYKKSTPSQNKALEKSLSQIKADLEEAGFSLGSIILIPDGSEISSRRLLRDAQLGGFKSADVDPGFKFNGVLKACKSQKIECIDFRENLNSNDYYNFDGHFRPSGVKKMAQAVANKLQ